MTEVMGSKPELKFLSLETYSVIFPVSRRSSVSSALFHFLCWPYLRFSIGWTLFWRSGCRRKSTFSCLFKDFQNSWLQACVCVLHLGLCNTLVSTFVQITFIIHIMPVSRAFFHGSPGSIWKHQRSFQLILWLVIYRNDMQYTHPTIKVMTSYRCRNLWSASRSAKHFSPSQPGPTPELLGQRLEGICAVLAFTFRVHLLALLTKALTSEHPQVQCHEVTVLCSAFLTE